MRYKGVRFCVFTLTVFKFVNGYLMTKSPPRYVDDYDNSVHSKGKFLCLFLGICSLSYHQVSTARPGLDLVYQWKQLEFDYQSEYDRQADIDMEIFIPGQPAPIDTDVYYAANSKESKVFVTIPRFQSGIPLTLGTVTDKMYKGNPVIAPYPSWSWHRSPKTCATERIVSVYRVMGQPVHSYEIPSRLLEPRSILVTPVIDIRDKQCEDTFVYIADCQTYSIIVHNAREGTFWKASDKTMYPYPNYGTFNIDGDSFDLMDGVLGMAVEPYSPGKDRRLFYHAMSSPTENFVYTSDLRNQSIFMHDPESSPHLFHVQDAVKEVMDGILPKKSRKIYEAQYDTFVKWCCQRKLENVNEDVLLVFFAEKSKTLSSSTLWAHYSMLKTMLNVKRNIDVSKFYKLSAFLKRKSEGYKPKKAKVLSLDQIDKFLLEAPDKDFLMVKTYRGERRTQSAAEAIDKNGVMYYGLMSDMKIACWNTKGEYGDRLYSDIVASDSVTLQFASGVKVVKNLKGAQELWIMTSRFQKVATDTLSSSETNFRIVAGKVDDLLFGTSCKGKKHITGGTAGGGYGLISTPRG
ncbi:hypothetical protein NQ315_002015 [Exocentrus adspersus]|uniref:Bee-milk protein n=1 Tax=Exocentrus adspersus TaxID=1586481 RepID=A0AAV8WCM6_9CUCU|nr:hypothetical protein NQ315_002015 [Exocentrus adspersus]